MRHDETKAEAGMNKVWIVTGSATGIGAGIAQAALDAGHFVVATDLDTGQLSDTYTRYEDRVITQGLDIRDAEQAGDVVRATVARFGRIDVLVNNAGYGQFGPFEQVEPEAIERQFATNVFGTMNVTREVLPVLRRQRSGHIINMSSNGGFRGVKGGSMYSATKFAIEGFSESLAEEVADFGIRVTIVEPGAFRTGFLNPGAIRYGTHVIDDYQDYWASALAVFEQRAGTQIGDPSRLGEAVVTLANSEKPPLRFVAGPDAVAIVEGKLMSVSAELHEWRELAMSTSFEAPGSAG
jgi:NAD(P)-dependent dehydrogenase (short-subunit alcohol dehydrogenase family)